MLNRLEQSRPAHADNPRDPLIVADPDWVALGQALRRAAHLAVAMHLVRQAEACVALSHETQEREVNR